jgi:hypothetical protein
MPAKSIRPAADPLDDIDRASSGVDSSMARQDRADLPGERSDEPQGSSRRPSGDVYSNATREVAQESLDPEQARRDDDREVERVLDGDPDVDLVRESLAPAETGLGADDDDPIDETERAGDDSIR